MNYILEGHTPVKCDCLTTWAAWMEKSDKYIFRSEINGVRISTVFLGVNNCFGDGPPLLFETMVFGGEYDDNQWRYSTWEEAEEGHKYVCGLIDGTTEKLSEDIIKEERAEWM